TIILCLISLFCRSVTTTFDLISYLFSYVFIPCLLFFFLMTWPPPRSTLFPYTTLFRSFRRRQPLRYATRDCAFRAERAGFRNARSEEHTSELQSHLNLVCRLLLEKKKNKTNNTKKTKDEHNKNDNTTKT